MEAMEKSQKRKAKEIGLARGVDHDEKRTPRMPKALGGLVEHQLRLKESQKRKGDDFKQETEQGAHETILNSAR